MISFNNLGNLGRLGNQMFQYASLKGIAKRHGYEFSIPPLEVFGTYDLNVKNSDINIYDVFNISKNNKIALTSNQIIQENSFNFDENLFLNCPDNIDIVGYYQSEKYFKHIEDEIREDFSFKNDMKIECLSFLCDLMSQNKSDIISLHIRRGDYLTNPNHQLQEIEYYERALKYLPSNIPVLIFSDDSEWCKGQAIFSDDRFYISEENSTDIDLCLMSLCSYHIIANSSFSWWGAWLAKESKKIIAPKNWFGGACINHSTEDLYCSGWIIL